MDDDADTPLTDYQDDSYGGLTGSETGTAPRHPISLETGDLWAKPAVVCGWPEARRL